MILLKIKNTCMLILTLLVCVLLANCGGGGGGSGSPINPGPILTPTSTPSNFTPNPTITNTPTPTPTSTPTSQTNHLVGNIIDITNNNPVSNCILNINGTSYNSSDGNFDFTFPSGNNVLTISGPNNITRETVINPATSSQSFKVLPSNFNTTFLRAFHTWMDGSTVLNQDSLRCTSAPHLVLYSKSPDGSDATAHNTEIIKGINIIKNLNLDCIKDLTFEVFNGRPADDPRWIPRNESTPTNYIGYIKSDNIYGICVAPLINSSGSTSQVFSDSQGVYSGGGTTIAPVANPTNDAILLATILHELAHLFLGAFHPFENILQTNWPSQLEPSVMNYAITGKKTLVFSTYDIMCLNFIYDRAPNNAPPDKNSTLLSSSEKADDIKIITTSDPIGF